MDLIVVMKHLRSLRPKDLVIRTFSSRLSTRHNPSLINSTAFSIFSISYNNGVRLNYSCVLVSQACRTAHEVFEWISVRDDLWHFVSSRRRRLLRSRPWKTRTYWIDTLALSSACFRLCSKCSPPDPSGMERWVASPRSGRVLASPQDLPATTITALRCFLYLLSITLI